MNSKLNRYYVDAKELSRFAQQCLVAAGVTEADAAMTAEGLVMASLRGIDSHGVRLLMHYVSGVEHGRITPSPTMSFEQTGASTGVFNADDGFGYPAGIRAMKHAMLLAKESGTGFIAVKNSSHCGILAYHALPACEQDMIGIATTHATAKMSTPNGKSPLFGNNPFCLTAPMEGEAPYCFDACNTVVTGNKIRLYGEQGKVLPENVAADKDGLPTTDPARALHLLPIGGHKGFGLSMTMDILCALLSGMAAGPNVSRMFEDSMQAKRKLGHFVGAIDISRFEQPEVFKRRLAELADEVRACESVDPDVPVMVPGDPEKAFTYERSHHGIPVSADLVMQFDNLSERYSVPKLQKMKSAP